MTTADVAPDLSIREAVIEDLPAIVHVFEGDDLGGHGDAWSEAARPDYERAFRRVLDSPDNTLFVVEVDGRVVGTAQLTIIPGLVGRGRTRAKLESVHVRPEHRGRSIGAALVSHLLAAARARGATIAELTSNKRRSDAHRFYETLGFHRSHEGFKRNL